MRPASHGVKAVADVTGRGAPVVLLGFALFVGLALALAARDLHRPGLYYDEVVQAVPAVEFTAEDGRPLRIPGATSTRVAGRWLPLTTQPYMGALKSQLLIPVFAAFDATPASLRATTLAVGLLGLGLAMAWMRELFGPAVALVAGALLALDPSFLFIATHDWGSFSLGLVCRCGALLLLTSAWERGRAARLFAGAGLLGIGLYNKLDFAVFLAGAGGALALVAARPLAAALRARPARGVAVALGFGLGATPVIAGLGRAWAATRSIYRSRDVGEMGLVEKLETLRTTLDGSHFHRLMQTGGDFTRLGETDAATGPFAIVFAAGLVIVGVGLLRRFDRPRAFAWLTALLVILFIALTPRAARIHHALNVYPFPHLVVAIAALDLWHASVSRTPRALLRAAVAVVLAASLAGGVRVTLRTLETIRETGGKGRWSDAPERFAAGLEPRAVLVSLDWGFHLPLRFTARERRLIEPIWQLRERRGRRWTLEGTPGHVYLLFPRPYAVFDYGAAFLEAAERLPNGVARIERHADRSGDVAFLSVRLSRPHRLVHRGGRFDIQLR